MSAFPPPPGDPLVALADRCVQCGLCLPACPTYASGQMEPESPRGRIALARAWAVGAIEPSEAGDRHMDNCLACRNCEAVCPAGVPFGAILVEARSRQRTRRGASWKQRTLEWLVTRPGLLTRILAAYGLAFPSLPARLRLLPRPPAVTGLAPGRPADAPADAHRNHHMRGADDARPSVALFTGCVARAYEPAVRAGLAKLLEALGTDMVEPAGQTCCGSLHGHAGNTGGAQELAARNLDAFAARRHVLTLASGCHESVRDALQGSAETHDALDFLGSRVEHLRFRATPARIALHIPCTQRNVTRSDRALRRLLAAVPDLQVVEIASPTGCCGASGARMLEDPPAASLHRAPLLEQLGATGSLLLLSANIGCRLHLGSASDVPVLHPVEFLAGCLAAP